MSTDFRVIQETMFPKMTDDLAKQIAAEWDECKRIYEQMGHTNLSWDEPEFRQFCMAYHLAWTKVHADYCMKAMENWEK